MSYDKSTLAYNEIVNNSALIVFFIKIVKWFASKKFYHVYLGQIGNSYHQVSWQIGASAKPWLNWNSLFDQDTVDSFLLSSYYKTTLLEFCRELGSQIGNFGPVKYNIAKCDF